MKILTGSYKKKSVMYLLTYSLAVWFNIPARRRENSEISWVQKGWEKNTLKSGKLLPYFCFLIPPKRCIILGF